MEEIQLSGIFGHQICRVRWIKPHTYRVSADGVVTGYIKREHGGWMLEEVKGELLTAENVQLIGEKIDRWPNMK
jgi:hypothetical protein